MSGLVIHVVGTDTDVGKTVATAAIASYLRAKGAQVAIYKPVQTGVTDQQPGDAALAALLSDADAYEGCRFSRPMAPVVAAKLEGRPLLPLSAHIATISQLGEEYEFVLVEGAGGVTVDLASAETGGYRRQNQAHLIEYGELERLEQKTVIVARSGLGTLNHIGLTGEYLRSRDIDPAGVVIGSWPCSPSEVEISNIDFLKKTGFKVLAQIQEGAGKNFVVGEHDDFLHSQEEIMEFRQNASSWFIDAFDTCFKDYF